MRRVRTVLLVGLGSLFLSLPQARAADPLADPRFDVEVGLELASTPYDQLFRIITDMTGVGFVLDPSVKGSVAIQRSGSARDVLAELARSEGFEYRAESGRVIVRKRVTGGPDTPALVEPCDQAVVPGGSVTEFRWTEVTAATRYRLTIGTTPAIERPVVDREVQATTASVTGLTDGLYYWRVDVLGRGPGGAVRSEVHRLRIVSRQDEKPPVVK
jgi:hypothetical protein